MDVSEQAKHVYEPDKLGQFVGTADLTLYGEIVMFYNDCSQIWDEFVCSMRLLHAPAEVAGICFNQ